MKNTKFIFLDVDGTLFSQSLGGIPDSAAEALRLARLAGHKIFLCTGRSLAEVSRYLNEDVDGFVLGAGAMVYADHKCIYDHPIVVGDVTRIKRAIHECGFGYSLEGSAGAYCNGKGYEALLWYFSGGEKDRTKQIANCMENCTYPEKFGSEDDDPIYKICVFGEDWADIRKKVKKKLEEPYIITKSFESKEKHFIISEITDKNITKATGIRHVLEHYGAESFNAYGFGDSANDIPMFRACAYGVAMGNGSKEIKEAADYITDDILENGIWNAFVHFGLIEGEKK